MQPYQQQYIDNTKQIAVLGDFYHIAQADFDAWFSAQADARKKAEALRAENIALLEENLFTVLDDLFSADEETLRDLAEFADCLMDWKTNLDCGTYVVIHDALLNLARVRKDRDRIIMELYKYGMGLYFLRRSLEGIDLSHTEPFLFQNELVFAEAASYLRYYDNLESEASRGYIIRAAANIAISTKDPHRKIAASGRIIKVVQDEHYRALAPGLPWDGFLRSLHQQMSANRNTLSRGNLTKDELAAVLDSCYEVFRPEEHADDKNIRWLWPYYEMEYTCGYVDLKTTLRRMEELILGCQEDRFDTSGLYGNIQLPIYYGRLMYHNPQLLENPDCVRFLRSAYERMMHTLLSIPTEEYTDQLHYMIILAVSDYFETEGVPTYKEVTIPIMQRYSGELYIRSRTVSDLMKAFCDVIYADDPAFFDDIPFLRAIPGREEKRRALLDFAGECGLYHAFGLIKMSFTQTALTRNLFENEYQMYRLYTVSGHADLAARKSTERFADTALGHQAWYNGAGGFPKEYVRIESPFRQITDICAAAVCMADLYSSEAETFDSIVQYLLKHEGTRFSPLITAYLFDEGLLARIRGILESDKKEYYREVYESFRFHEQVPRN